MSKPWMICEGECNRVLWVEDGPICPDCKAKEPEAPQAKAPDLPKKDAEERKGKSG